MNSNNRIKYFFVFLFLLFTLWVTGCQKEENTDPNPIQNEEPSQKETLPSTHTDKASIKPFEIQEGEFYAVSGWLNDETVVYITNIEGGSNIYTNNIFTGENNLIYKSPSPIVTVNISPSSKQLLIHSSPTTYEGLLTVINADGKEIMTKSIPAFELEIEWNAYNDQVILISVFSEDWEFSSYQLNIKEKTLTEIQIREPFAQWLNKDDLLFLDWSEQNPSLFAPLVKMPVSGINEEYLLENIFQFKAFKDIIMTITVPSDKMEKAVYTFLKNDFHEISFFSVPHLTRFSDWLVPYFDLAGSNDFVTFKPLYSTAEDTYAEKFQLINFDIENGKETVISEGLENEPLSCLPNGEWCLYGYYFEKLLNLKTKEIIQLVKK